MHTFCVVALTNIIYTFCNMPIMQYDCGRHF